MNNGQVELYDVAILGGGVGGSTLAAIVARHGLRVLLVEADSHPRFTIGESTVPETAGLLRIMALRYSVPEIGHLATYQSVRHHVSSACGVKRGFSFVYHREGQPQHPEETTQFPTLAPPFGPDVHWFRQDIDAYVFAAAIRYGAVGRQRLRITQNERRGDRWYLASDKGEKFEARYLVDAGGIRSPMAEAFGLRDNPPRQRTNTRSMFTHMVGVRPYDQCVPNPRDSKLRVPFYQTTLHHVFDGGWLWVIPFDNHPDSTNPLCSVGLQLDRRKIPDSNVSPDEEWRAFLQRFPSIALQFENARPVRDWVRSNSRLQFSSHQSVGEGYCLLPHAAGFIDPLFSSGLGITMAFINNLAGRLIRATQDNDFSPSRFEHLEGWLQHNLDHFDKLVSYAYDSWADFRLWNAWFRVWVLGNFIGSSGVISRQLSYMRSGDARELARMEEAPYGGIAGSELPVFAPLFDAAAEKMEAFAQGELSAEQASDAIFGLLAKADFIPTQMRLAEPEHRSTSAFTTAQNMRLYLWGALRAPDSVRQLFYTGVSPFDFFTLTARGLRAEIVHGMRTILASIRDHIRTWNAEWKHKRYDLPARPRPVHHVTERNTTSRQEVRSRPELPKREAHPGGP